MYWLPWSYARIQTCKKIVKLRDLETCGCRVLNTVLDRDSPDDGFILTKAGTGSHLLSYMVVLQTVQQK